MFEEIALEAGGILIFFFLIMISFIMIWGWMFFTREDKMERTSKRKLKNEKHYSSHEMEGEQAKNHSSSEGYTLFHALFKALKEEEEKHKKR